MFVCQFLFAYLLLVVLVAEFLWGSWSWRSAEHLVEVWNLRGSFCSASMSLQEAVCERSTAQLIWSITQTQREETDPNNLTLPLADIYTPSAK